MKPIHCEGEDQGVLSESLTAFTAKAVEEYQELSQHVSILLCLATL